MKLLQKLLLVLVTMMMGSVEMKAADPLFLTSALDFTRSVKLTYQSVDANNNPVTLSEMLYFNKYYPNFKSILVSNHPTTTQDALVPTGSEPQIPEVKVMCDGSDRCLVIAPDYLGYGESKDVTHPYMCSMLTARNVVDGIVAAIDYIQTQYYEPHSVNNNTSGRYVFNDDYYTLNVGYSQGGAATLAVHKYLETIAPQTVREKVRLKKSICGAGPHLQTFMFDAMEELFEVSRGKVTVSSFLGIKRYKEEFFNGLYENSYPLYIPYIIDGLKYTFGNSIMRALNDEEIYTKKFLESGLLGEIREKNIVAANMNQKMIDKLGTNGKIGLYDIIRPEYKDRNSKLYRTLRKALKQCDLLEGWIPTLPIDFYHWKGDEVVPFDESQKAYDYFKSKGCNVNLIQAQNLDVDSYWQVKSYDRTHMGYGTKFYLSIFSGSLR